MSHPGSTNAPVAGRVGKWQGIQDCVHCGLCLTSCPTYLSTGVEMSSPRGRLVLIRAGESRSTTLSPVMVRHLDQCLGCLACEEACPSTVPYGQILHEAREQIGQEFQRGTLDRVLRWVLLRLFPYPERLGAFLGGLHLCQRLGVVEWAARSRTLNALVPRLAGMASLLPKLAPAAERQPLPVVTPAEGLKRGRIALLTGCAQRALLPGINRATVRVLAAAGYEVVAPTDQGCCGALHLHAGDVSGARRLGQALMQSFEGAGAELIVSNAAGCGAAMKGYGQLFADDPAWQSRATMFASKVRDVSEILAGVTWNGRLQPVPLTVTYHDACHLAHGQRIRNEPRALLEAIPALRLVELPESDVCCGSGGVYNVLQPRMARLVLDRKIHHIVGTGASVVAAGNIGCLLQLRAGLVEAALPVRCLHPVELVDWSLHGQPNE